MFSFCYRSLDLGLGSVALALALTALLTPAIAN